MQQNLMQWQEEDQMMIQNTYPSENLDQNVVVGKQNTTYETKYKNMQHQYNSNNLRVIQNQSSGFIEEVSAEHITERSQRSNLHH